MISDDFTGSCVERAKKIYAMQHYVEVVYILLLTTIYLVCNADLYIFNTIGRSKFLLISVLS